MSGFFGQILGGLAGSGATLGSMGGILTQLIGAAEGANAGGIPGLIAQFENAGLGNQIQSWIGTGENLPVTAEQVATALPAEQLEAWAQKLGVPQEQLAAMLADILPHAVDHATPAGEIPATGAATPDLSGLLGRLLGR
jgi:uncharacterized protein YidB (DUF937 family)